MGHFIHGLNSLTVHRNDQIAQEESPAAGAPETFEASPRRGAGRDNLLHDHAIQLVARCYRFGKGHDPDAWHDRAAPRDQLWNEPFHHIDRNGEANAADAPLGL